MKSHLILIIVSFILLVLLVGVTRADISQTTSLTTRVSVSSDGTQGNFASSLSVISANGRYVAFVSCANNLVIGDTNNQCDIFVHDTHIGLTSLISVASDGTQGNDGVSLFLDISDDGRYVTFGSFASNLVSGDTNDTGDVFVHDQQTGQTSMVSVSSDGVQGNYESGSPVISANGRYVAFSSGAENLIPDDSHSHYADIFVHNTQTGETNCASVASDGTQGNGQSRTIAISDDGQFVFFSSDSSNLIPNDTNGVADIFIHDQQSGQTSRISVTSSGVQGNNSSDWPAISANGRYVAFRSYASNLIPNDTNGMADIFMHDRQTGQTNRISVASNGTQGNGDSYISTISADGRYVAFGSDASNLVLGDTNNYADIFVHDIYLGQTSRVSLDSNGMQGNGSSSYLPAISGDGRYVTFVSDASNLVPDDTNGSNDVFVRDLRNADMDLAERFAPYMYFHQDEPYRPIAVTIPLHYSQLTSTATPSLLNNPDFYDLMTPQWNDDATHINLKGDGREDINNIYSRIIEPATKTDNEYMLAYARVQRDDVRGKIAIQYWFYYYANPWVNYHEGDWEMVQVVLDSDETPLYAAYTHHLRHSKRWWSDMETSGDHPIVYVAKGAHGNYFKSYRYWQLLGNDETSPYVSGGTPQIEMFPDEVGICQNPSQDSWPCFQGRWGASPEMDFPGPGHVIFERWEDPLDWSEGAVDLGWDENGWHNSVIKFHIAAIQPFDVHVYEMPTLAHVGWNNGQPEIEIDDAEYFDNPATGIRTILLHSVSPINPLYQAIIKWRPSNSSHNNLSANTPLTTTINFPDIMAGTSITATYTLSNSWGISSTGIITVSHNGTFDMMVDIDGDGIVDQQIIPTLEENPVDFIPPAAITNLSVTPIESGTATLNWTASGDDENNGTATAYDIRYSTTPITDSNWVSATLVTPPIPSIANTAESFMVTGVPGRTLYFAIRSVDEVYHFSTLSNVVEVEIPPYTIYLPTIVRY